MFTAVSTDQAVRRCPRGVHSVWRSAICAATSLFGILKCGISVPQGFQGYRYSFCCPRIKEWVESFEADHGCRLGKKRRDLMVVRSGAGQWILEVPAGNTPSWTPTGKTGLVWRTAITVESAVTVYMFSNSALATLLVEFPEVRPPSPPPTTPTTTTTTTTTTTLHRPIRSVQYVAT